MGDSSLHIETGRLLLRPPVLADLAPWAAMMQDAEAAKFIGGVQPRAACWRSLMTMIGAWQAMGFALEGAIATIDWAFAHLGWSDVVHTIAPENTPSIRLAQRLGSLNRGPVQLPAPHAELRVDLWAQTRAQWLARRAAGLPPSTSTPTDDRGQQ